MPFTISTRLHELPKSIISAGVASVCCSMLEGIQLCEEITGRKLNWRYEESNRVGDHIWWISDIQKFKNHYPNWDLTYNVRDILTEIFTENVSRWD